MFKELFESNSKIKAAFENAMSTIAGDVVSKHYT